MEILVFLVVVAIIAGLGALAALGLRKLYLERKNVMTDANPSDTSAPVAKPKRFTDSLTVRAIAIGVLALLMTIPLSMVSGTVNERRYLFESVQQEIASIWGNPQVVEGPALVVPYIEKYTTKETVKDEKTGKETTTSKVGYTHRTVILLPKNLDVDVELRETVRHRGIYKALVYTADVRLRGEIPHPDFSTLTRSLHRVDWDKAYLALSLSDTRAINQASQLTWNDQPLSLAPGTRSTDLFGTGFHAPLGSENLKAQSYTFDLSLSVNGSRGIRFAPFGEDTQVRMTSSWPHPSFQGSGLPTSYETRDDGFDATWSIPHLVRNYPQVFRLADRGDFDLSEYLVGVDLFEPVFLYSKITRAVKYGLLFVGLTFLVFLIFELISRARLHFVQYGLIGIALSLFYLTLLSLAEHVDFQRAYMIASAVNIGMITVYAGAALRSWGRASIVLVLLSTLYTLLFSLLHLEDYALLMGTALLVVVVGVLMYLTRGLRGGSDGSV